jgi:tetratricopeptide (TPR) repeat protein
MVGQPDRRRAPHDDSADHVRTIEDLVLALDRLRRTAARGTGRARVPLRDLAVAAGVPLSSLSRYLRGSTLIPPDALDSVVLALGVAPADARRWADAWDRASGRDRPRPPTPQTVYVQAVPRLLPPDTSVFCGREEALAWLDNLRLAEPGGPAVICAIAGTAGVGKTALAVHWAYRVAEHFADGQLYVNLRGYAPAEPMPASAAQEIFLRALGVTQIPPDDDQRTALYRSTIAERSLLMVLDNARYADQIRPLLPTSGRCFVLVTSRDSLSGLVARDGAQRLLLNRLAPEQAIEMLERLLGPGRVQTERNACHELIGLCGALPLAIRVAAEHVTSDGGTAVAGLVGKLRRHGLDLLGAADDPLTDVRTVLSWSYRCLPAATARMFRLLGVHPGPDIDVYAAASLAGVDLQTTEGLLHRLRRTHLIEEPTPGRYAMHDLLRAYAVEEATADEPQPARLAALTRVLDHYRYTAKVAMDILYPHERHLRPQPPRPRPLERPLQTAAEAAEWLVAEHVNLIAAVAAAAEPLPAHTVDLASIVARHWEVQGRYHDAATVHRQALQAARARGDRAGEVTALRNIAVIEWRCNQIQPALRHYDAALDIARAIGDRAGEGQAAAGLGTVHWRLGHFDEALTWYRLALTLHRTVGDRATESRTLGNLALLYDQQGRPTEAIELNREAIALARASGDQVGESRWLGNLGLIYGRQGRYQQAREHHETSLAISRQLGDRGGAGRTLANLGLIDVNEGLLDAARRHFEEALALGIEIGDRASQGIVLANLAEVAVRQDDLEAAMHGYRQALTLARQASDRSTEICILNGLGAAARTAGDLPAAVQYHRSALAAAEETGYRIEQARAHEGIARAQRVMDQAAEAAQHFQRSLQLYRELDVPEAQALQQELAALSGADGPPGADAYPAG